VELQHKQALVKALCAELDTQREVLAKSVAAAKEAATHEESKPENDKDTRALEASYLAGAQAARLNELKALQNTLAFMPLRSFARGEAIAQSAVIELESAGKCTTYLLGSHGGGLRANNVAVITAQAPLAQLLLGKCVGDEVELTGRVYKIRNVW